MKWHEREATGDEEGEEMKMGLGSKPGRHSHFPEQWQTCNGEEDCKTRLKKFSMNESAY